MDQRTKISENSHFEAENGGLEDDFLLQMGDFWVRSLVFTG